MIFRDIEGACHHAIAAANALFGIVGDSAEFSYIEGRYRTDRSASWFKAMHALASDEYPFALLYDRPCVRIEFSADLTF